MTDALRSYFRQEFIESWFFVGVGLLAIGLGVWLFSTGNSHKGAAWPLVGVGLIQLAVGLTVGLRTPRQADALEAQLTTSPAQFREAEIPRMEAVMKSFRLIKAIEIILAVAGLVLTFLLRERMFWFAFGVGLFAQASISLVLDLLAEHRGGVYLDAVRSLGT